MKKAVVPYVNKDWYQSLLEEIGALITEKRFEIEESIIRAKHEVGRLICEQEDKAKPAELVLAVSRELKVSTRTIEQAVQFYKFDPELQVLQEGKNISWRKCLMRMQTKRLKEPCEHEHTKTIRICADCGDKLFDELDEDYIEPDTNDPSKFPAEGSDIDR